MTCWAIAPTCFSPSRTTDSRRVHSPLFRFPAKAGELTTCKTLWTMAGSVTSSSTRSSMRVSGSFNSLLMLSTMSGREGRVPMCFKRRSSLLCSSSCSMFCSLISTWPMPNSSKSAITFCCSEGPDGLTTSSQPKIKMLLIPLLKRCLWESTRDLGSSRKSGIWPRRPSASSIFLFSTGWSLMRKMLRTRGPYAVNEVKISWTLFFTSISRP